VALDNGYGVLIGRPISHWRDPPDDIGRYFHVHICVAAPGGPFRCAVDVDSKAGGVLWRTTIVDAAHMARLSGWIDGWRPLAANAHSGALDYLRSPMLRHGADLRWRASGREEVAGALEDLVARARRVFVFGEPFGGPNNIGDGVHNVHQNQGDPVGSGFSAENGIWQDGALIVETNGDYVAFLKKFSTQAERTDDAGRPL
jgi:hypothetical protein